MTVDIFIPCFIDQVYPSVAINMVKVLEDIGCTVNYNSNQTCCGQPAFNAGFWEESKAVANKFVKDFKSDRMIVVPSSSCVGFIRNNFKKVLNDQADNLAVNSVIDRTIEFSEFLTKKLKITNLNATLEGRAAYHDSCSALREINVKSEPRILLEKVKKLQLVEFEDATTCCGFGGTFSVKYGGISNGMLEQKVEALKNAQVDYLISADMSCLMHIEAFLKKQDVKIKVLHLADVLSRY